MRFHLKFLVSGRLDGLTDQLKIQCVDGRIIYFRRQLNNFYVLFAKIISYIDVFIRQLRNEQNEQKSR